MGILFCQFTMFPWELGLIVKSPPFLTAASAGFFSLGQVTSQTHNCSESISSSHRHLIFRLMCKLETCSLILPLLCMTSAFLLLIKSCEKKAKWEMWAKSATFNHCYVCFISHMLIPWNAPHYCRSDDRISPSAGPGSRAQRMKLGGGGGISSACLSRRGTYIMSLSLRGKVLYLSQLNVCICNFKT